MPLLSPNSNRARMSTMAAEEQPRILDEKQPVVEEPTPLSRNASNQHGSRPVYRQDHMTGGPAPRRLTQEEQNEVDDKAQKRAMDELVGSWMDRLQQISIITTFFAAMESQLVGSTLPVNPTRSTYVNQIANAALTGALVMHVFAAILSFLAAFFLIRYKLAVAKQKDAESGMAATPQSTMDPGMPKILSSNPHLEQVGPFRRGEPPTHLLDHCHTLCMWLAMMGFMLSFTGLICFTWSRLAWSGAIFASGCMIVCFVLSLLAFFWPASSAHRRRGRK